MSGVVGHEGNGVSKQRKTLFTDDVLDRIPVWVLDKKTREWIALEIGCTVKTLVVTCSKHRISLDRRGVLARQLLPDNANHKLPLSRVRLTTLQALQTRADDMGIELCEYVTILLERIAADGLFKAILDSDEDSKRKKRS